jgi:hypothetical protein
VRTFSASSVLGRTWGLLRSWATFARYTAPAWRRLRSMRQRARKYCAQAKFSSVGGVDSMNA